MSAARKLPAGRVVTEGNEGRSVCGAERSQPVATVRKSEGAEYGSKNFGGGTRCVSRDQRESRRRPAALTRCVHDSVSGTLSTVEPPTYATQLDPAGPAAGPRKLVSQARAVWRSPLQRRFVVALVAALGSALVFARITEDYLTNDPLARWDVSLAGWLVEHRSAVGVDVFRVITNLGSPAVSLVIAAVVCVVLYRRVQIADAALLPLVLGGGELLNLVLKFALHRARPGLGVVQLDTYSYPSGHAMIATATYGAFAYLLWRRTSSGRGRILISLGTVAIIVLISVSRMYLGVHYLSDVLGAVAAGATWLALSIALQAAYGERFVARFTGSPVDRLARRLTRA